MRAERMVHANGVELCVQECGPGDAPAVLLIPGACDSMNHWPGGFCERIAAGGRRVIRYDPRDTGRSTTYPPGAPGYAGPDLAHAAVALLHVLGTGPAHLVGISMGGALAQLVAADRPERVASLTLISTSPGGAGLPPSALPPLPPEPDWSDREAVVDYEVALARAFAGGYGVDEPRVSARAERVIDRSVDIAASRNHWNLDGGPDLRSRLSAIAAPTLVIHGTDDPLFPLAHGEALAREIPGADLFVLEKVGHEVPPRPVWDMVVAAILRHTA